MGREIEYTSNDLTLDQLIRLIGNQCKFYAQHNNSSYNISTGRIREKCEIKITFIPVNDSYINDRYSNRSSQISIVDRPYLMGLSTHTEQEIQQDMEYISYPDSTNNIVEPDSDSDTDISFDQQLQEEMGHIEYLNSTNNIPESEQNTNSDNMPELVSDSESNQEVDILDYTSLYPDFVLNLYTGSDPNIRLSQRLTFTRTDRERDIELVMSQTTSSFEEANQALDRNNNDIVNAIMDLINQVD